MPGPGWGRELLQTRSDSGAGGLGQGGHDVPGAGLEPAILLPHPRVVRPPKRSGHFRAPLGGSGSGAARAAVCAARPGGRGAGAGGCAGPARSGAAPAARGAPRLTRPPAGLPGSPRGAAGRGRGVRNPRDPPGARPRCWAWRGDGRRPRGVCVYVDISV